MRGENVSLVVRLVQSNVEIEKSKNELFAMSYKFIYLATFYSFWPSHHLE